MIKHGSKNSWAFRVCPMADALIIRPNKKQKLSTIFLGKSLKSILCVYVCGETRPAWSTRGFLFLFSLKKRRPKNVFGKKLSSDVKKDYGGSKTKKKKRELKIVWLLFKEDILTTIQVSRSFVSGLLFISSPRIVAISPCMKAQGTLDPASGHFSPLGQ